MSTYRFTLHDHVAFKHENLEGEGVVVGVMGNPVEGLECHYLIRVIDDFPHCNGFTTIAVKALYMRMAAPYKQPVVDEEGTMIEFSRLKKKQKLPQDVIDYIKEVYKESMKIPYDDHTIQIDDATAKIAKEYGIDLSK